MTRRTSNKSITSLLFTLLLFLSCSHDMFVSAQVGTVQSALFDYIMNMQKTPPQASPAEQQTPAPPAPPAPPAEQPPVPPPRTLHTASTGSGSSGSGSNMFDMYGQLMKGSQQTTPSPLPPVPSGGGAFFMDVLNKMTGNSQPKPQPEAVTPPSKELGSRPLDPMTFYNQLKQVVNQPPAPQPPPSQLNQVQPQPQPQAPPKNQPPPFLDPFPATAPPPKPAIKPPPKILPFVPPEWNLPRTNNHYGHTSGSSPHIGWGHGTSQRGYTGWEHPHHHQPAYQTPHPQHVQRQPPPHPMSRMSMVPSFRDMVNKQATQFGDLPYYQQHGCVDPTPTRPGPGGIRPTQTLWYGCNSPVSRMVCMRVGQRSGHKPNNMAVMMSMMNPIMTRTLEKCLTPKMATKMMLQGFSGGTGPMNPMMMMMMMGGGGGGGGMAGMLPMMMMMRNQQNQRPQSPAPGPDTFGPAPPMGNKQTYSDPSTANTLISQAARIPAGAAQPSPQSSSSLAMNPISNILSLGGSQTPVTSKRLPTGAASPGPAPSPAMHGLGGPAPGEVDCSSLTPLMLSKMMAGGEGLNSPEAMEAIGEMRKQFLPYSCQELRIKYTGLPLRLCCPGKVEEPSIFDLFKAKNAAAGA